jgi:3-methyladenine DNA glycosylase/8-oxoguanine DNA glycosylase
VARPDPFEAVLWAVVSAGDREPIAQIARRRIIDLVGAVVADGNDDYLVMPSAATVAASSAARLQSARLTEAKASQLVAAAAAIESRPDLWRSIALLDGEAAFAELAAALDLPSVMVQLVLVSGLAHRDFLPAGDRKLLRAAQSILNDGKPLAAHELRQRAVRWKPFRGWVAALLMDLAPGLAPGERAPVPRRRSSRGASFGRHSG